METMRTMLWTAAVLGLLTIAQDAPERVTLHAGAALVTDGGRAAFAGLADSESGRAWAVAPLSLQGDVFRSGEARKVLPAGRFVEVAPRVDVLRRLDSSWTLVADLHGGGSRMLELMELPKSLLDANWNPDDAAAPPVRRFTDVEIAGGEEPESFVDLFAPRLVESGGKLRVVASSLPVDGLSAPVTWIAPLPAGASAEGERLAARRIGAGADARLAHLGDQWCCIVRTLAPHQGLEDAAPVHVHFSKDLETWTPGLPLSMQQEVALVDYDLIADGGALWLVGVRPGTPAVAGAWRLDAVDRPWQELKLRVELPSATTSVRLLDSSFGAPVPKLVFASGEGVARVVPIAAK